MSHSKERLEKNCLNCNANVAGRYCQVCGQENIEPKESFWHLVTHYFYDITHFDGQFFYTLKYLLWKPGFLSIEYMRGRRNSYLNPIKMYVFTSAIFFLFFFSTFKLNDVDVENKSEGKIEQLEQRADTIDSLITNTNDKNTKQKLLLLKNEIIAEKELLEEQDSSDHKDEISGKALPEVIAKNMEERKRREDKQARSRKLNASGAFDFNLPDSINSYEAYLKWQNTLPENERNGWAARKIVERSFSVNNKFKHSTNELIEVFIEKLLHSFPQMFFLSLPLFALMLRLLYWRRKDLYYVNHLIFSIHQYIGTYIIVFFILCIELLKDRFLIHWLSYAKLLLILFGLSYLYRGMKTFYNQSNRKTVVKYVILSFSSSIFLVFLMAVFAILTLFKI